MSSARLRALSDEELLCLVAAGRCDALEALFDRYGSAAFSLARRVCRSAARAEDVVQESFLCLWRGVGRYEPARGSVRTWLLGIVHHRAIDNIRRHGPSAQCCVSDDGLAERLPAAECTESEILQRAERRRIRDALAALPAEQRRVIELAFFDGLTHSQIASLLSLAPGTVKGRMRLGLAKLRQALATDEVGYTPRAKFVTSST
jgi:RNA polymerase sigma-70 factor (ECF subfamily)